MLEVRPNGGYNMPKKSEISINKPVKKLFTYCGFTAQIGSITGQITIKGQRYYYVYTGKKRRVRREDGSTANWEINLWICPKRSAYESGLVEDLTPDYEWSKIWLGCDNSEDGKKAQKLLTTNPRIQWTPKIKIDGERNALAYVPKQKNLGFIYAMVRERQ